MFLKGTDSERLKTEFSCLIHGIRISLSKAEGRFLRSFTHLKSERFKIMSQCTEKKKRCLYRKTYISYKVQEKTFKTGLFKESYVMLSLHTCYFISVLKPPDFQGYRVHFQISTEIDTNSTFGDKQAQKFLTCLPKLPEKTIKSNRKYNYKKISSEKEISKF